MSQSSISLAPASQPSAPRLLVVHGNLLERVALNRKLQRSGFEVMTVADGNDAIRVIDKETYELVLIDIAESRGLDILRQIRENQSSIQLPVILINGSNLEGEMEMALGIGANDYMNGPLEYEALLLRITAMFSVPTPADIDLSELTCDSIKPEWKLENSTGNSTQSVILQETDAPYSGTFMVMNLADSSLVAEPVETPSDVLPAGEQLGNYSIIRVLGRGAMGVVYEAFNHLMDRNVALKTLSHQFAFDTVRMELIQAEARLAARVEHTNVVGVYEMGNWKGTHFVAMQLVRGPSLQTMLETQGALAWEEATRIVIQACHGLAAVHDCKLIHRDIKPANIMIGRDGVAKLTDFGLAQARPTIEAPASSGTGPANPSEIVGTPHFMSPEQCRAMPLTVQSDVYSMGATYYKLLTGLYPYNAAKTVTTVLNMQIHAPVPDPRQVNKEIPLACSQIIAKAMAKHPVDRYVSARQMIAALNQVSASA